MIMLPSMIKREREQPESKTYRTRRLREQTDLDTKSQRSIEVGTV